MIEFCDQNFDHLLFLLKSFLNSIFNFKIGHVILAEFERTISNEDISRFVSILEQEENTGIPTGLELLNEITKLQYGLWKGLVQKYFGNISHL